MWNSLRVCKGIPNNHQRGYRMSYNAVKPENVLVDDKNYLEKDGKMLRKGTVAAALANAEIFESIDASTLEKQKAIEAIKELAPALKTLGLTKFLTWKNKKIQEIFDNDSN